MINCIATLYALLNNKIKKLDKKFSTYQTQYIYNQIDAHKKYKITFDKYNYSARIFAAFSDSIYFDIIYANGYAKINKAGTGLTVTFNTEGGYKDFIIDNQTNNVSRVGIIAPSSAIVTFVVVPNEGD